MGAEVEELAAALAMPPAADAEVRAAGAARLRAVVEELRRRRRPAPGASSAPPAPPAPAAVSPDEIDVEAEGRRWMEVYASRRAARGTPGVYGRAEQPGFSAPEYAGRPSADWNEGGDS